MDRIAYQIRVSYFSAGTISLIFVITKIGGNYDIIFAADQIFHVLTHLLRISR